MDPFRKSNESEVKVQGDALSREVEALTMRKEGTLKCELYRNLGPRQCTISSSFECHSRNNTGNYLL